MLDCESSMWCVLCFPATISRPHWKDPRSGTSSVALLWRSQWEGCSPSLGTLPSCDYLPGLNVFHLRPITCGPRRIQSMCSAVSRLFHHYTCVSCVPASSFLHTSGCLNFSLTFARSLSRVWPRTCGAALPVSTERKCFVQRGLELWQNWL